MRHPGIKLHVINISTKVSCTVSQLSREDGINRMYTSILSSVINIRGEKMQNNVGWYDF